MLLESSVDIIILFDRNGYIAYCSNSFLSMAGIPTAAAVKDTSLKEIYERYGYDEFVAEFVTHAIQRFSKVKSGERLLVDDSMFHAGGDRKRRFFTVQTTPLLDQSDAFDGMMVVYHDITELVRAQKQAEEAQRQAEAANQSKSRFLASMSHEIRTPMNAILGMGELMRTDNFDELQKRYFSDIQKMSRTLLEIINDILDFSKIEAGKLELVPVHFSLLALLDHIYSLTSFTIKGQPLEFKIDAAKGLPETLYSDETRWRQIITNLVSNAVKYTRRGYVRVLVDRVCKDGKDYIKIMVTDTGIGIKPEDLPKLFGLFQQFDQEKNKGIVGTGLGLSITKRLVDMMGGEIAVESEYGKGTAFTVLLPLIEGNSAEIQTRQNTPKFIASADAQVLVVDDNATNLTVALGFLETHNIRADTAMSGREALEKLRCKRYDLIFMDHMMPEMDGVETVKRIRALDEYRETPIIALSANAVRGMGELFINAGMNGFISKPIDGEQLNRVLSRWLPTGASSATPAESDHEIPEALLRFSELDVTKGISYIGNNAASYLKALHTFCTTAGASIAGVSAFLSAENWEDYRIKVHGLKGVFASIGADTLSQQARFLESAAKTGNYAVCRAETEAFCKEAFRFKDALTEILSSQQKSSAKRKGDRKTLAELLRRFQEYGNGAARGMIGMSDKLDELSAEAETITFDADADRRLQDICLSALSFDYAGMLEKTDKFIAQMAAVE
jgi:PAS domain S-box-containing protein